MLWKTEGTKGLIWLCALIAVVILFFLTVGGTPTLAEQTQPQIYASVAALCPKCKEPLTVVSTQDATCEVRGYIEYNCDECNQYHEIVYGEEYAPHDWKVLSSTPATCIKSGSLTRQCKECKLVTEVSGEAALGHDYRDTVVAPTCSAIGYTDHTCDRCGETYRDSETAMIAHTYDETVEVEPTCQTVGFLRHTCSECGYSYTEEMPVVEHNWNYSVVEPTHTEQGFTVYSCSFCETVKRGNFTDPRPYDMVWTVQEATCTAGGLKIGYCSDGCGHTETEQFPKLNHDFGEWITIRKADEEGDGIESHVCSRCQLSEMRYIPYNYQEQVEEPLVGTPKTNWLALGCIAVVSVVGVILVVAFLLLLLEHARKDRVKRSRKISESEAYYRELSE
jgi:hypothetical protein